MPNSLLPASAEIAPLRSEIERLRACIRELEDELASEESQAQLRAIFKHAAVGLSEISVDGRFLRVNDELCRMLVRSREELLQLSVAEVTHPDDIEPSLEKIESLLQCGETTSLDKRYLRGDGTEIWANSNLSLSGGPRPSILAVSVDLTERKQDEARLRESEERLRIAVDAGELGTWDWEIEPDRICWNDRHFLLFGMTPREGFVTSSEFTSRVHPDDIAGVAKRLKASVEECVPFAAEFRIVRDDNREVRWMNGSGRVVEQRDGRATRMCGVMFDFTERRRAQEVLKRSHEELEKLVEERTRELEQALAQKRAEVEERQRAQEQRDVLLKRIVNTQEEERGRISRELHDNLGQHLTAVMLGLQTLENQIVERTPPGHATEKETPLPQLENLRGLVDGLMRAAHRQAWELRPAELDAMGLEAALGQYVHDWSSRTQIPADFQAIGWGGRRLAREIETTLYRIVQEALTNVARHANANRASVILELSAGGASAIVEDDGQGFDPDASAGRLGLLGMRERISLLGGTLEIESSTEGGTTLFARISQTDL